jgi:hypothetical protein
VEDRLFIFQIFTQLIRSLKDFKENHLTMHRRTLDSNNKISLETFEDKESVIRNSKSKDRQQRVKTVMVNKTLHRNQRSSNRNSTKNRIEISCPDV